MAKERTDQLTKQVRDALALLNETVDEFNHAVDDGWEEVEAAQEAYNDALAAAELEGVEVGLFEAQLERPEELVLEVTAPDAETDEDEVDDEEPDDEV